MTGKSILAALAAIIISASGAPAAKADAISDFYKGKKVTLIISSSVGGGYNRYARTVARHVIEVVGGLDATGAGHVLGDDGRVARDVFSNVARYGAGIAVVAAADRRADDQGEFFALVEICDGVGRCRRQDEKQSRNAEGEGGNCAQIFR